MKFDTGKPPINLVPSEAIIAAANVFAFGAQKYGENNWRRDLNDFPVSRHYASIMRHMLAWNSGEDIDPESGLPHLHHAMTQLMILTVCQQEATADVDDRFLKVEPDED
tara:strand:+ start:697 stop:1023 length:327 start_codon:yes stop_codon:yes gene_type:complete